MEAARRGDAEAWQRIYDHLGHGLTRYAASRGVSDPEDLTQEVMHAAAQRIHRFSGDWENLRSWLFTIAYRRCADHHRRRARSPEQLTCLPPEYAGIDSDVDGRLCADGEAREAFAALDILEERERDVVILRVIHEMDTREVAGALGLSRGNVRVIQSRALAKLRRYLEANGGYLDKRFRNILVPAVVALEKMHLLRGLAGRLTTSRIGRPVGAPPGASATVTGGVPHTLAVMAVAAGVTAGAIYPGPPHEVTTNAIHPQTPVVAPVDPDTAEGSDDRKAGVLPRPHHPERAFHDRRSAPRTLPGVYSTNSLLTDDPSDRMAEARIVSQATAAVAEGNLPVGAGLMTDGTEDTVGELTAPDVEEGFQAVTNVAPTESADDTAHSRDTHDAITEATSTDPADDTTHPRDTHDAITGAASTESADDAATDEVEDTTTELSDDDPDSLVGT